MYFVYRSFYGMRIEASEAVEGRAKTAHSA
jgi:hypothetical protein